MLLGEEFEAVAFFKRRNRAGLFLKRRFTWVAECLDRVVGSDGWARRRRVVRGRRFRSDIFYVCNWIGNKLEGGARRSSLYCPSLISIAVRSAELCRDDILTRMSTLLL